jgi:hypothetical protein
MVQRTQGWGGGAQWRQFTRAAIGGVAFTGNQGGVVTVNPGAGTFVPIGNGSPAHPLFALDPSVNFQIVLVPALSPNETQFQKLRYVGAARDLCVVLTCSLAFQDPALGAFGTAAKLTQNGVDIPNSEQEAQTGGLITSADSLTVQGGAVMQPGDEFQILVANITDGGNFVVSSCHLTAIGL